VTSVHRRLRRDRPLRGIFTRRSDDGDIDRSSFAVSRRVVPSMASISAEQQTGADVTRRPLCNSYW
jgi:hypothetical protein